MKRLIAVICLASLIMVNLVACQVSTKTGTSSPTSGISYATGFTIEDLAGGVTKLTDGEKQTLLLVPKGKKVPAGYESAVKVTTPVKRSVILSVTFGALMRPLGVLDSLVGSGTVENEIYLSELKDRYTSGQIKYIGGGAMGDPDYEAIRVLQPDIVFVSTGYPGAVDIYNKIKGMGINVAVCNDYLETDAMARLEWIKFIAAFYGKNKEADSYFRTIEQNIADIKTQVKLSSSLPGVLWASIFGGTAYVSGGDSYVAKWIDSAGGRYVFADLKGSGASSISLEELYARGKGADIFIYASTPPYINSIKEIVDNGPILADIPTVKNGTVYCLQPWFYQIADKPDEIYQDLAAIFHPDRFPGYKIKNFMLLPAK